MTGEGRSTKTVMSRTDAILKRLTALYPRFMDLDLARERRLLDKLAAHVPNWGFASEL